MLAALAMSIFVEAGWGFAADHGDGVWRHEALGPWSTQRSSHNYALGLQAGRWRIGGGQILTMASEASGTELDADYDAHAHRCLAHCGPATLAHFSGRWRVDGLFARYQYPLWRGLFVEPGALLFLQRGDVRVKNYWMNGVGPLIPDFTVSIPHRAQNLRLAPSLAIGYDYGHVQAALRGYLAVKSYRTEFSSLNAGPLVTLSVSVRVP